LENYLSSNKVQVADTLLGITDARAANSPNRVVRKAYQKMRPMASRQVQDALPGVARLINKYL